MGLAGRNLHDALGPTGYRTSDQGFQGFIGVVQRAPEHGDVGPGDHFDVNTICKTRACASTSSAGKLG